MVVVSYGKSLKWKSLCPIWNVTFMKFFYFPLVFLVYKFCPQAAKLKTIHVIYFFTIKLIKWYIHMVQKICQGVL